MGATSTCGACGLVVGDGPGPCPRCGTGLWEAPSTLPDEVEAHGVVTATPGSALVPGPGGAPGSPSSPGSLYAPPPGGIPQARSDDRRVAPAAAPSAPSVPPPGPVAGPYAPPGGPPHGPMVGPFAAPHPPGPTPPGPGRRGERASPGLVVGVGLLVLVTLAVGLTVLFGGSGSSEDLAEGTATGAEADDEGTSTTAMIPPPPPTTAPPTTAPVPPGRVPVDGVGYRWTMSAPPLVTNQPDPSLPPGKVWLTVLPSGAVESVQVLFLPRDTVFDLDAGLTGVAMSFRGSRTDIADAELAGQPARTAGFVGTAEDGAVIGRVTLAIIGDRLVAALVVLPSADGAQLPAQFEALATSLTPA